MTGPLEATDAPYTRPGETGRSEEPAVKQVTPTAPRPVREPEPEASTPEGHPPESLLKRIWTGLFAPRPSAPDRTDSPGGAEERTRRQQPERAADRTQRAELRRDPRTQRRAQTGGASGRGPSPGAPRAGRSRSDAIRAGTRGTGPGAHRRTRRGAEHQSGSGRRPGSSPPQRRATLPARRVARAWPARRLGGRRIGAHGNGWLRDPARQCAAGRGNAQTVRAGKPGYRSTDDPGQGAAGTNGRGCFCRGHGERPSPAPGIPVSGTRGGCDQARAADRGPGGTSPDSGPAVRNGRRQVPSGRNAREGCGDVGLRCRPGRGDRRISRRRSHRPRRAGYGRRIRGAGQAREAPLFASPPRRRAWSAQTGRRAGSGGGIARGRSRRLDRRSRGTA